MYVPWVYFRSRRVPLPKRILLAKSEEVKLSNKRARQKGKTFGKMEGMV
jgi:hypothetical protein